MGVNGLPLHGRRRKKRRRKRKEEGVDKISN
jgi:hypothetical protein